MAAIVHLQAETTVFPMKSPFESAKRRNTEAENVLITLTLDNGVIGYGEASPADYVTGETPAGVMDAAQAVPDLVMGLDARRTELWCAPLRELEGHPTLRSAVEMALLDAQARTLGIPLWQHFGGASTECRTDLTIPMDTGR
jgi:L-alanine-DL-glutamate epimerase-like enolase superfamily enzyme